MATLVEAPVELLLGFREADLGIKGAALMFAGRLFIEGAAEIAKETPDSAVLGFTGDGCGVPEGVFPPVGVPGALLQDVFTPPVETDCKPWDPKPTLELRGNPTFTPLDSPFALTFACSTPSTLNPSAALASVPFPPSPVAVPFAPPPGLVPSPPPPLPGVMPPQAFKAARCAAATAAGTNAGAETGRILRACNVWTNEAAPGVPGFLGEASIGAAAGAVPGGVGAEDVESGLDEFNWAELGGLQTGHLG